MMEGNVFFVDCVYFFEKNNIKYFHSVHVFCRSNEVNHILLYYDIINIIKSVCLLLLLSPNINGKKKSYSPI
jgi:hypothetical protein